jgi:hypothetical protein
MIQCQSLSVNQNSRAVRVLPGTYWLRNAVFLRSGVRIAGSGEDSVLVKEPSVKTTLAEDADFYQQEVALAENRIEGFSISVADLRRGA